jgi:hypothetical protein
MAGVGEVWTKGGEFTPSHGEGSITPTEAGRQQSRIGTFDLVDSEFSRYSGHGYAETRRLPDRPARQPSIVLVSTSTERARQPSSFRGSRRRGVRGGAPPVHRQARAFAVPAGPSQRHPGASAGIRR